LAEELIHDSSMRRPKDKTTSDDAVKSNYLYQRPSVYIQLQDI